MAVVLVGGLVGGLGAGALLLLVPDDGAARGTGGDAARSVMVGERGQDGNLRFVGVRVVGVGESCVE